MHNGNIESVQPENVSIIKEWFEDNNKNLPEGAILVQSGVQLIYYSLYLMSQ